MLGLLCLASALFTVRDIAPITGPGDAQVYEYTGYYLSRNLRFGWVPSLRLDTDQLLYPYGTNAVFQPWGLERDCFYAALHSVFGSGPWLALYFVLSVLVTGLGSYALARRDLGAAPAFVMGAVPGLFNFHALYKYSTQFGYAIVHWTILGFVADFVMVRRFVRREPVGARWLVGRLLLLILSLGQDLTYVASYSLLSAAVSAVFAAIVAARRNGVRLHRYARSARRTFRVSGRELAARPLLTASLLVTLGAATWLFVPLSLDIVRAARSFHIPPSSVWWVSPVRLLVPFFPFFHPVSPATDKLASDLAAGGAPEGTAGWFLLALAFAGLYRRRGARLEVVPTAVVFVLCALYSPGLRTLNAFPWFSFFRVGSRSTNFYPVMLAIFSSGIDWRALFARKRVFGLLMLLGAVELGTAWFALPPPRRFHDDPASYDYLRYVGSRPGEAVLDFPFCVLGGNGVGTNLCRREPRELSVFTLQRFHGKSVVGGYFGRLHPSQIEPYVEAGWDRVLAASNPKTNPDSRECLRPEEWRFFTDFFRLNDFAGINLWVDMLTESCKDEFHRRFGAPVTSAIFDGVGRVEFLPKSEHWAGDVDRDAGRRLRLVREEEP